MVVAASADVTPSNVWTSFYGSASTYNGQPVPLGSIIDAYDSQGIHCGTWVVGDGDNPLPGRYGFMPVYGDESSTPEDEGATLNDNLTFKINNRLAVPEGPGDPVWAGQGERIELNLSASAEVGMEPVTDVDTYTLQGSYTFGNNIIRATWAYADINNTGNLKFDDINFYEVGYQHNLSKRTRLWVEYIGNDDENRGGTDSNAVSIGVRHDF